MGGGVETHALAGGQEALAIENGDEILEAVDGGEVDPGEHHQIEGGAEVHLREIDTSEGDAGVKGIAAADRGQPLIADGDEVVLEIIETISGKGGDAAGVGGGPGNGGGAPAAVGGGKKITAQGQGGAAAAGDIGAGQGGVEGQGQRDMAHRVGGRIEIEGVGAIGGGADIGVDAEGQGPLLVTGMTTGHRQAAGHEGNDDAGVVGIGVEAQMLEVEGGGRRAAPIHVHAEGEVNGEGHGARHETGGDAVHTRAHSHRNRLGKGGAAGVRQGKPAERAAGAPQAAGEDSGTSGAAHETAKPDILKIVDQPVHGEAGVGAGGDGIIGGQLLARMEDGEEVMLDIGAEIEIAVGHPEDLVQGLVGARDLAGEDRAGGLEGVALGVGVADQERQGVVDAAGGVGGEVQGVGGRGGGGKGADHELEVGGVFLNLEEEIVVGAETGRRLDRGKIAGLGAEGQEGEGVAHGGSKTVEEADLEGTVESGLAADVDLVITIVDIRRSRTGGGAADLNDHGAGSGLAVGGEILDARRMARTQDPVIDDPSGRAAAAKDLAVGDGERAIATGVTYI